MKKYFGKVLSLSLVAAALAGTIQADMIKSDAAIIIQPGVITSFNKETEIDTTGMSPDAADYMETGGTAQGSMTISTYIPDGCVDTMAVASTGSIVEVMDKYGYEEMVEDLEELKKAYSDYFQYRSIGTTADGRSIYEAVIGNESAGTHILITASTHAREYITTLLVMEQIEYVLESADKGAFDGKSIKSWLNDVCMHFVPMVNPDGVELSIHGIDAIRSESLQEKIREAYDNDLEAGWTDKEFEEYLVYWKANANCVNINDNFNALTSNIQTVTDKVSSQYYYGTPGSEAETKALSNLVDSRHFKAAINYHAMGSVIYWNYEGNQLVEHCRDLSNNVMVLTGYTMITSGTEGGSFKSYLGTRSSPVTNITVEVGRSQAPVDISEFETIWNENKFVPFYTMKWALEKGK